MDGWVSLKLEMTVEEGIERLKTLNTLRMQTDNNTTVQIISKPSEDIEQLFTLANITAPEVLPTTCRFSILPNSPNIACLLCCFYF
jgi:hypothetical protein